MSRKIASMIESHINQLEYLISKLGGESNAAQELKTLKTLAESKASKGKDTFFEMLPRSTQNLFVEEGLSSTVEQYLLYMNKAAECFVDEDDDGYEDALYKANRLMNSTLKGLR